MNPKSLASFAFIIKMKCELTSNVYDMYYILLYIYITYILCYIYDGKNSNNIINYCILRVDIKSHLGISFTMSSSIQY